ncbi:P-loop containing nucleoside triphosphate hydrolase protein [Collybia nuda]|uniref:P-loop containing nucleoside triphosphate hydrolase protein n=1 Tax=Collybia nuda TaxID=64659 RepID=A0A9P5Y0K8_9AGAR|nr:P-loop containing nucleoside triphosphate hydrolase protein [Collybia nuda]
MSLALVRHYGKRCNNFSVISKSYSTLFKDAKSAEFVAAAGSVDSIPKLHGLPEVIVTGRANSGKSTLFNTVLGRKALLHTSKKAGRTRELNFFRVGAEPGKLILVDAPGYGARGRPEWGEMFDKYIETRKELRRVYILFNGKHSLNNFDIQMLSHLSRSLLSERGTQPFTLQSVITKADCIPADKISSVITKMRKDIWQAAPLCLPPIVTSAEMSPPFGIDEVRRNIAEACGLLRDGR